uniref:Uncharacterized protein n=1 Tax=Cyprinodon variegatus TaxID=28743 RepID=A0A3Q2CXH8_CYPVA
MTFLKKNTENLTDLDSCAPTFTHGVGTRRIDHGHEADEAKVLSGEVHFFSVKGKALRELVIRKVEMTEPLKRKKDLNKTLICPDVL